MKMNLQELAKVVKEAANAVHGSEKFMLPALASRASKAAEQYPYDSSVLAASQILTKMASEKPFISRSELNSLYEKVYSNNTKLGEVFAEELDRKDVLKGPQFYDRTNEGQEPVSDFERVADPVLANALSAAFDGGEYKVYSQETARKAEKVCNAGLMEIGLAPKKISVFAGQEDIILCQATYETPKGQSNVIVPVEIKEGSALLPTMFLGVSAFADLKEDLLKSHIISTAGQSYQVDGEGLLKILSTAKHGVKKVASEVEMAAIRLRHQNGSMHHDPNSVIGMKIADPIKIVEDPEIEKSAEHFEFAERVTSQEGAARFIHNDRVVDAGRDIIVRKMAQFGYPNAQVKVANCNEKQIHYAVGVGVNAAIMAPVDIVGNNVFPPKVVVASGKIKSFSQDGVKELVEDTTPDTRMLAASSMSAGLKPTELVQQVKDAVAEGNLIKAEDAINVLGEVDKHAQKVAIAILMKGLSPAGGAYSPEVGNGDLLDAMAGVSSNKMINIDEKQVRDVPVFNSYNVFFPEE